MINTVYSHSFKELEEKAVTIFSESLASGTKMGAQYKISPQPFDTLVTAHRFHFIYRNRLLQWKQ